MISFCRTAFGVLEILMRSPTFDVPEVRPRDKPLQP